ncbi:MAG TPA: hypothetical protein DIS79_07740 [Bacteroidetes bacterium]|nr:hypothetical protein [Bacteroidota bacterium]HRK04880.1 DUF721 domain-containing protein [Chlorobiota bacterium]
MSKPLGELLGDVIRRYRLQPELDKARLPQFWADAVGPLLARRTSVRSFDNGVLVVHVEESAWRSEILLRREELRSQLNARFGSEFVREIIVR